MNNTANAVFALLLLASGYLFLRRWKILRPHVLRNDGHALYFIVVVASFVMGLFSALVWHELVGIAVVGPWAYDKMNSLLTVFTIDKQSLKLGATAVTSVPLAFFVASVANWPLVRCGELRQQLLMRLSSVSELEELFFKSSAKHLPIMVSLAKGKVYVGFVKAVRPAVGDGEWIRMQPFLSGYRGDDHRFKPTTPYSFLYDGSSLGAMVASDFDVLIPTSEVTSLHAFDMTTYAQRFQSTDDPSAVDASKISKGMDAGKLPKSLSETLYWIFTWGFGIAPLVWQFFPRVEYLLLDLACALFFAVRCTSWAPPKPPKMA